MSKDNAYEDNVYIGETTIQIGQDGFINQPKEIIDYIKYLQKENEFLKLNNPEMNLEHFRVVKENKRKINNLRKNNKQLKSQLQQKENIIKELEHDFKSYDLEYLRETYQGSLADFIETELKRIQELKMGVNR